MSSQRKQIKQRVFSAKPGNFRQSLNRPISGMSSHTFSRKELIQNVYTTQSQAGPMRTASAKALSHRALLGLEKSKKIVVKQSRKKEQLEEEIMRLKQTINQLMQQLSQQKGKTQSMRKKGQKYSKLLSIQFENETHWNSSTLSSHLVIGIKNTYDMLKDKYESLQQEHQLLLKKKNITKELELITYIEVLERENKTLNERLEKYMAPGIQFSGGQIQSLASSNVIAQIQANHYHLSQKYNEISSRYQMCLEALKDRNKKIEFLEKLILQKDNNTHASLRQTKKLKEQVAMLRQVQEKTQKNYEDQLAFASKEIENLKERLHKEKESYEQNISKEMQAKYIKIAEITRQNEYLHQMSKELRTTNNQLSKKVQQIKVNNTNTNILETFVLPAFTQLEMNYLGQHQKTVSNPTSRAEQFQGIYLNGKRIPQKADKKHHENAVKCRKILRQQVTEIVQLAKLKLIEAKFSLSKVKQLFDSNPGNQCGSWEQQYITMKQAKQVLIFPPFSLSIAHAQALARYLVEDVQADYVYFDDFNENTREIVKSILKTLLGNYPIFNENSNLDNQVKRFMKNYSTILENALKKMDSSGKISHKRFEETLNSLGMECSEDVKMILLGRMSKSAQSINQLYYRELFK